MKQNLTRIGMEKHWPPDYIPESLTAIASKLLEYKPNVRSMIHRKNTSVSGNRKTTKKAKQNNHINSLKAAHTRNNSQSKRARSKCETEMNWSKRRKDLGSSKETIRNKNSSDLERRKYQIGKSSLMKTEQFLSSKSRQKKVSSFNSTSYNRKQDIELDLKEQMLINSDIIIENQNNSYQQQEKKQSLMKKLYDRTNRTLSFYQSKCEDLENSCNFFKKELSKAIQKLQRLKKKQPRYICDRKQERTPKKNHH